ncbi:MAG: phenylalanine--tRNA ligase subunit beta [Myxococcota bacterium]
MLISRAWLQELLVDPAGDPLPDDDALSRTITSVGLEVEGVERVGSGLEAVVVGQVRSIAAHPNADRLRVVELDDGTQTLTVVCGAPNVPPPGGNVAFAPVGLTLPGGLTLEAREVRGVQSHGMICSEQELEIGPDHDGILVLPTAWSPGQRLCDRVAGIEDTIFELSITPNRPDALGHIGVARDLAIKLGRMLVVPPLAEPKIPPQPELVTVEAPQRCGQYFGYALEGAKVGPSPLWLRVRLHRLGLRPINNVVDITNLVLMEWGQPLHCFDRAKLAQGRVVIRMARPGESMTTLDETTLELREDDLVIADAEQPQALAGVMGGLHSGVLPGADTLLLEAAWFSPRPIRRTARRHQLSTDSSYRFERGVDHGPGLARAASRALGLLERLAGARCVGGHVAAGQRPPLPQIVLRPARTRSILGMDVPDALARKILAGLDVEVDASDPDRWVCQPPTHRPDLEREVDLIEEIMRIHGLDDLPAVASMPTAYGRSGPTGLREPGGRQARADQDRLIDALAAQGLHEVVCLAFAEPKVLSRMLARVPPDPNAQGQGPVAGPDRWVHLTNPMRGLGPVLRAHLLPGLLDAAALNVARHTRPIRIFEVGRVYHWGDPPSAEGPTAAIDRVLPDEPLRAGVLWVAPPGADDGTPVDGPGLAGLMLDALEHFGLEATLRPAAPDDPALAHLHPGVRAQLSVQGHEVGSVGAVHPDLVEAWDLPEDTAAFYGELRVDALPPIPPVSVEPLPRFPATSRDVSLDLAVEISASTVVAALAQSAAALPDLSSDLSSDGGHEDPVVLAPPDHGRTAIEVVEDYRGKGVEPGRRALLLRLGYRARGRSVSDAEVQARHEAIIAGALEDLRSHDAQARAR